jgi:hypothetical protein
MPTEVSFRFSRCSSVQKGSRMTSRVQIENIEEMRRRQGIDDVELHEEIRLLMPGDVVKVSFVSGPTAFETLSVRITSIKGSAFRGKLASRPHAAALSRLHVGSSIVFYADHIHSISKGQPT